MCNRQPALSGTLLLAACHNKTQIVLIFYFLFYFLQKIPKTTQYDRKKIRHFCTKKSGRTLRYYLQQITSIWKWCLQEIGANLAKMHLVPQLIHLLFTEALSEVVSMEGWLSNHSCARVFRVMVLLYYLVGVESLQVVFLKGSCNAETKKKRDSLQKL